MFQHFSNLCNQTYHAAKLHTVIIHILHERLCNIKIAFIIGLLNHDVIHSAITECCNLQNSQLMCFKTRCKYHSNYDLYTIK